jgi:hypothetical protein
MNNKRKMKKKRPKINSDINIKEQNSLKRLKMVK